MNDLIANPAFQSGIAPFAVALVFVWLLRRAGGLWVGLAFVVAYYVSVYLTVGLQFTPLTSTRKIILLGLIVVTIGLASDLLKLKRTQSTALLTLIAISATIWVIWPVVKRLEGTDFWITVLSAGIYSGWIGAWAASIKQTESKSFASLGLGLGTGISALLGASALLGQLGIAIGAIGGAFVLMHFVKKDFALHNNFIYPVALLSGLLGVSGTLYADLPWYSLVPLGLIPALSAIPINSDLSHIKKNVLACILNLTPAVIAISITWSVAGAPPI